MYLYMHHERDTDSKTNYCTLTEISWEWPSKSHWSKEPAQIAPGYQYPNYISTSTGVPYMPGVYSHQCA